MFLFIDESKQYTKKVFGGILLPISLVPDVEHDFAALRIKHKLFGELKWELISRLYYERYYSFLDLFLDNKNITYHSICFRDMNRRYNAAYTLIRTITWKLQNCGSKEPLYILFDNDGNIGSSEIQKIKDYAKNDRQFKLEIEFCNQGTSHVMGCLQLSDILTGAMANQINHLKLNPYGQATVDHIISKNANVPLGYAPASLPSLKDYKIHYFDPNDKLK